MKQSVRNNRKKNCLRNDHEVKEALDRIHWKVERRFWAR